MTYFLKPENMICRDKRKYVIKKTVSSWSQELHHHILRRKGKSEVGWGGLEEGESMCKAKFYRLNYFS